MIIPDIGDVEDNLSNDDEPIEHRIYKVIPTELLSINNSLSSSSTSLATASYQQSNQQKKGRGRPRKSILENEDSNDKAEENLCQDDEDVVVIQSNNVSIEPSMAPRNTNKANVCSSSNSEWCIICQRRVPRIVHHYVNEHPGCEVYCSRLSDEEVEVLRRNKSTAKPSLYKNGQLQYEKECIFCSKVSRFMLPYWYQHFAMHTGEYAYRCDGCNIRKPTRSLMMAHIGQPCPKGGQICQDYNYENKSIEAKICMLCNYVQLNRANVTKHLRTQHKIKNVLPKHIQSIVLLRIPNAGRQSLHTPNSLKPNVNYSNLRTAPSAKTTTIRRTIGNEVFEISEIEDDQNVEAAGGYWSTTPNDDNNYLSNSADQWQSDEDGGFDLSYMICGMLDVEMNTNE